MPFVYIYSATFMWLLLRDFDCGDWRKQWPKWNLDETEQKMKLEQLYKVELECKPNSWSDQGCHFPSKDRSSGLFISPSFLKYFLSLIKARKCWFFRKYINIANFLCPLSTMVEGGGVRLGLMRKFSSGKYLVFNNYQNIIYGPISQSVEHSNKIQWSWMWVPLSRPTFYSNFADSKKFQFNIWKACLMFCLNNFNFLNDLQKYPNTMKNETLEPKKISQLNP